MEWGGDKCTEIQHTWPGRSALGKSRLHWALMINRAGHQEELECYRELGHLLLLEDQQVCKSH